MYVGRKKCASKARGGGRCIGPKRVKKKKTQGRVSGRWGKREG